jgi:C-terminal processing protease CtpA/Prc
VKPVATLALLLLFTPACKYLQSQLPTEQMALVDMEEPLPLHEEPKDEEARRALPPGGFTGAYVSDARQSLEEMEEEPEGVLVNRIIENSPADAAGLREGDLLLEANGKPLRWASEWRALELETEPGATLEILYDRAGAELDARVNVVPRVHHAERQATERYREESRVGIVVRTATEVEARAAGLGPGGGAVVVGLARGSPWRAAGLKFGDLIVEAGEKPISHPDVLLASIRDAPEKDRVRLVYLRDGERQVIDAPVSRRAQEMTKITVPLLYVYEKDRDLKRYWFLLWIYQHKKTPAAWETTVFWFFKFRGGDADRLEEVEG